jgi:hypothetical protein
MTETRSSEEQCIKKIMCKSDKRKYTSFKSSIVFNFNDASPVTKTT